MLEWFILTKPYLPKARDGKLGRKATCPRFLLKPHLCLSDMSATVFYTRSPIGNTHPALTICVRKTSHIAGPNPSNTPIVRSESADEIEIFAQWRIFLYGGISCP